MGVGKDGKTPEEGDSVMTLVAGSNDGQWRELTPQEAHLLWVHAGKDSLLFVQHAEAARQAGFMLRYRHREGELEITCK